MRILVFLLILPILIMLSACKQDEKPKPIQDQYTLKRDKMVTDQIISRNVKNNLVLSAMRKVPRHEFVREQDKKYAYEDTPLEIGEDQTISQPYIVALMTELLELKGEEKVLEIGTGSGYQAAILAEIAKEVYTIEIIEPLADNAQKTLKRLGYNNIAVKWGDGYQGWKEHAPFDEIIVTAAPDHIPQPLIDQLKVGGRLVIPVGSMFQKLELITKTDKGIIEKSIIPVRFVPMTGEAQRKKESEK